MMILHIHSGVSMLAFFQATQLSLFERFLNQAVAGINSTNITSGMQNVAYVVLLVGFLWQVYQSALHGGDVRSLGTNLIKYVVTALIVMNYSTVFSAINQGFVNAGNWISNASGASNLFENWASDLKTQFSQDGTQKLWELITGDIPALLDGLLIIVAYLLYPFVIAIFGFFYIFYGSILYIFGPIVIALMPLGATNRLAKSYVEHVMIWNAWPILYGGFGALLSAVQMGQIGQMLGQNDFLGGFGNLEGSLLIGIASIIYSIAIAVIPFIAKRIVSGDVGATAGAMIGAAATALTLGTAAVEGGIAGASTAGTGSSGVGGKEPASGIASQSSGSKTNAVTGTGNQPAAPQRAPNQAPSVPAGVQTGSAPAATTNGDQASPLKGSVPNAEGGDRGSSPSQSAGGGGKATQLGEEHAARIRSAFMPGGGKSQPADRTSTSGSARQNAPVREKGPVASTSTAEAGGSPGGAGGSYAARGSTGRGNSNNGTNSSGGRSNAPNPRREGLATWGAYHAARLATRGIMNAGQAVAGTANQVAGAIKSPVDAASKVGTTAGKASGAVANAATRTAQTVAHAVSHPVATARQGAATANSTIRSVTNAANRAANTAHSTVSAVKSGFSSGYDETKSDPPQDSTEDSKV